jgi:tetratricopeptide (TPR) repeat protein
MSLRTPVLVLALALIAASTSLAQTDASATPPADFNERMNTALQAENNHDYETAYKLYKQLVADSPPNRELLMQSAIAARGAGHAEEALALYQQAIKIGEPSNKHEAMVVIPVYAALGRWDEFDKARLTLRAAALADPTIFSGRGYLIEEFKAGTREFRVIEYPALHGHFNTRYRFLVASESTPDFTPYYDLESDDGDQAFFQKDHPDLAQKGERMFSLDSYPKAGSQALMGFFEGEPSYEKIRAIVSAKAESKPAAINTPAQPPAAAPPK